MKFKHLLFMLGALTFMNMNAQKNKVESRPPAFDDPLDLRDFYKGKRSVESGTNVWEVFSDRANNPIYKKERTNSDTVGYAEFKEYFLVKSESAEWVEVATYQTPNGPLKVPENLEVLGWMPKSNLLLWKTALLDSDTKIERKAFLLNQKKDWMNLIEKGVIKERLDAGEEGVFQKKKAYDDPDGGEVLSTPNIYRFYFVYKKEGNPGNQRWLLAGDSYYPFPKSMQDGIVGWFSERDLQAWNTNLSMEPNFEEDAFQERTNNANLRVRSFLDENALLNISTTYSGDTASVFVSDQGGSDVVGLALQDRSTINSNRHTGSVIRFPYLGDYVSGNVEYYKSGQIGNLPVGKLNSESTDQIPEITIAKARSRYNSIKANLNKVNVCIMVEATANTKDAKPSILQAVRSLKDNANLTDFSKNVKYQTVLYRKPNLGDVNEIKMSGETGKLSKAVEFIENASFADDFGSRVNNSDNGVLLYKAIEEVMQKGIFRKEEANILLVLGCNGDVNTLSSLPEEYVVDDDDIRDINLAIRDYRAFVHLFRVIKNTDQSGIEETISKKFGQAANRFIMESGTLEFTKDRELSSIAATLKNENIVPVPPELEIDRSIPSASLINGKEGFYYWPSESSDQFEASHIGNLLNETIDKSLYQTQLQVKSLQRIVEQYKDLDTSALSSQLNVSVGKVRYPIEQGLIRLAENGNFSEDDLRKLSKDKLDLFTHVYLIKKPKDAKYNSLKFVVFMTHKRLTSYQNLLKTKLLECQQPNATLSDKKRALENMQLKLFENLTGGKYVSAGQDAEVINNKNVGSRIRKINEIVEDETSFDEKIDGIHDLKSGAVNNRIKEFEEILDQINGVLAVKQSKQDLVLETADGQRYYWLTFEELF